MKKQFYLLFAILVAFSSLFVSCDENGPDSDPTICKITVMKDGDGTVSITSYIGMSVNVHIGNQVEVVATPAAGCAFTGWYLSDGETLVSTEAKFIFTASENTTLIARFTRFSYLVDGYECVDLGLSVKWATCNVGASKPEEYGGYYAWGETEEKSNYDWSTYKWCNGSYDTMTKYCTNSSCGTVDNKTVLDPQDDIAHVKWGGTWRMPTKAEQDELRNNCTWTWTTQNGVKGYKVTGPNGNSIFLPAAGYRDGTDLDRSGGNGYYWSNSLNEGASFSAYLLNLGSSYYALDDGGGRYYGFSVRPVSE